MPRWGVIKDLAQELHLTPQRVGVVLRNYTGKRNKKGQLNLDHAKQWYEEHTQQARRKRNPEPTNGSGKTPTYFESQAKKEAAIAGIKELELLQKEGELFPVAEGVKRVMALANAIKDKLQAMEERLPARLAKESDRRIIKQILKSEHNKALGSIRDFKFT